MTLQIVRDCASLDYHAAVSGGKGNVVKKENN